MHFVTIAFTVCAVVLSYAALGNELAAHHPLFGAWKITDKRGTCIETYDFRSNGIAYITSGREVAEVAYNIATAPSAKGFYRWSQKIIRDNGEPDCSGNTMRVGDEFTWFIQFDAAQQTIMICNGESNAACFGPLQRQR